MALPDQADIVAQNEQLTADLAAANGLLTESQASVTTLTAERDAARARVTELETSSATLTTERDAARADVTRLTADNARLTADMASFEKRVAAELVKHGIRTDGSKETETPAKPLTLTEKVLAARAAKSQTK